MKKTRENSASAEPGPANAGGQQEKGRESSGRFRRGFSGNPAGRREGSRNRATLALQSMLENEGERIVRKAIQMALEGDPSALRLVLERLVPVVKDRAVVLDLPKLEKPSDIGAAVRRAAEAMFSGELTPSEAETVSRVLEALRARLVEQKKDKSDEEFDALFRA
jgi:hypothetical protein